METLLRDLRHGVRLLWKQPSFTLAAVAVLALGIGANSAMFSLVNSFLLKPLVIEKPEELVGLYTRQTQKPDSYRGFSYPEFVELRQGNTIFSSLTAHNMAMVGLADGAEDTTRRVFADIVSANYFSTFGVPLFRGRAFTAEEERPSGAVAVAIVSHSFWKRTGADPQLVGKPLRINGRVFTIVGIAPPGFSGTTALISCELYLPFGMYEALVNDFGGRAGRELAARDNFALILIGRLRPGLTPASADAQLQTTAAGMEPGAADEGPRTLAVRPLSRVSVSTSPSAAGELRLPSILLQSMASIVLLIASLNVANMMLARGSARRREIAIRLAMGANRRSVLLQLCTEGFLLACLGGVAGLAVAYWSTTALVRSLARLAPIDIVFSAAPDLRIVGATLGFCILSTVLFALGPALGLSRPDVFGDLKGKDAESAMGTGGRLRGLLSRRNLMVIAQLALSLMLLTAAGLFFRSSLRAASMRPGFDVDGGLIVETDPSLAGYDATRGAELNRALLGRLQAMPGVESASLAATVPFGMVSLGRTLERSSDAPTAQALAKESTGVGASFNIIGPEYFKTLGIPLLRGRAFAEGDTHAGTSRVAILDRLAAERLWPNGDALGQRIRLVSSDTAHTARKPGVQRSGSASDADAANQDNESVEVVGIVSSVQERVLGKAYEPQAYVPFGQEAQSDMSIHLRTAARTPQAAASLLETVRREVRATDPRLPVLALRTLRDHLENSFDFWLARTAAVMFSLFGAVALVMAVIGLYGVRAYSVSRRTREIGIRLAIGASAGNTMGMVLGEGLKLTAIGVGAGLLLALALGKLLSGMLYEVSGVDPVTFIAASLLLSAASMLACYIPARRAARIEPMVALRYE